MPTYALCSMKCLYLHAHVCRFLLILADSLLILAYAYWFLPIPVDIFYLNNNIKMWFENIDTMHKTPRSFFLRSFFYAKGALSKFLLISADSLNMIYKFVLRFHCTVEWKSDFLDFFPDANNRVWNHMICPPNTVWAEWTDFVQKVCCLFTKFLMHDLVCIWRWFLVGTDIEQHKFEHLAPTLRSFYYYAFYHRGLNWNFLPAVACKIQVWYRIKIKFIKLHISN